MHYYEVKGKHFISALNANIDEIDAFKNKCRAVAMHYGFDAKRARLSQPALTNLFYFGGIQMTQAEYDAQPEIHKDWMGPNSDGYLRPENHMLDDYRARTAKLSVTLNFFEVTGLPEDFDNYPGITMRKDDFYFVQYQKELQPHQVLFGVEKVTEQEFKERTQQ